MNTHKCQGTRDVKHANSTTVQLEKSDTPGHTHTRTHVGLYLRGHVLHADSDRFIDTLQTVNAALWTFIPVQKCKFQSID